MRKLLVALSALMAMAMAPAVTQPVKAVPGPAGINVPPEVPQDGCQPNPLETRPQLLRCRYGPLQVSPGQNLILLGPVTIESPRAEGFMTSMKPNMVHTATGAVPPIHEVHLHHGVWLNLRHSDPDAVGTPFMAAGEEKTISSTPPGYGYRVHADDEWILNYMIHNLTAQTYSVFITYELGWINASSPQASGVKEVVPLWFDEVGGLYPVYNPTNTGPEVRALDAASGVPVHVRNRGFRINQDMDIVWMAGHVHPGGLRLDVNAERCKGASASGRLFTSEAVANVRDPAPPGSSFGSWDYRMSTTPAGWSYGVKAGDRINIDSVYDIGHPWYEAMGIVFGWGHPLAPGEQPARGYCTKPVSTTGPVTNDVPDVPTFGGTETLFDDPSSQPAAAGDPVTLIRVAAFDYQPGGLAQRPAPVAAGSTVRFDNLDAAGVVYHSITSCADGCNKDTGQSYPKPSWLFDSGQLGYGVWGATAAEGGVIVPTQPDDLGDDRTDPTNTFGGRGLDAHGWRWQVPASAPVGTTYPFFCRVHPFMRGSMQVVE